jgi:hypothetical protein
MILLSFSKHFPAHANILRKHFIVRGHPDRMHSQRNSGHSSLDASLAA